VQNLGFENPFLQSSQGQSFPPPSNLRRGACGSDRQPPMPSGIPGEAPGEISKFWGSCITRKRGEWELWSSCWVQSPGDGHFWVGGSSFEKRAQQTCRGSGHATHSGSGPAQPTAAAKSASSWHQTASHRGVCSGSHATHCCKLLPGQPIDLFAHVSCGGEGGGGVGVKRVWCALHGNFLAGCSSTFQAIEPHFIVHSFIQ
jgi:hypothetical protein